jgi:hypothetical protein
MIENILLIIGIGISIFIIFICYSVLTVLKEQPKTKWYEDVHTMD